MRTLIVTLVFANLAFAAWALLIDRPAAAPAARDISHLQRLVLASEPAAVTAKGDGTPPTADNGGRNPGNGSGSAAHCVTVGPFSELRSAASASAVLQGRGFAPTQRDEPGEDVVAYWVYLDNLASDAAATRMLQRLRSSGVNDAHVMPVATASEPRRVSVGFFNEHGGAERRARQIKALGFSPAITEQHQPQATYWIDVNLTATGPIVSTEGLLPTLAEGTHLEIRDCPAAASSAPAPVGALPK